jgi:V8-like Glu-specific endopeptidase
MKIFLASLFLTGCIVGSSTGNSDTDIIGGSNDGGDPAVGLLRLLLPSGQTGFCTATAIAPTVAISAAHCAVGIAYDVSFLAQPNVNAALGGSGYIHAQLIPDPAYNGNPVDGHDVSVVLLTRSAPATVSLGAAPAVGAPVRAVGYGMNVFGQDGTGLGVRRQVGVTVDSVSTHEIVIGFDGQTTCHGDSGGPIFDASGALVATDSYGDPNCHSGSHDMRIDDSLDFIKQFLASGGGGSGSGGGGTSSCDASQNGLEVKCTNGNCACLVNGTQVATCTASNPVTACSMPGDCCGF